MDLPKRKPNRLPDFDYGVGGYFITICTCGRKNLFWNENVGADTIRPPLSEYGQIAETAILSIHDHYPAVAVDKYVVMPNHVHMILRISEPDGRMVSAPTSVSTVIGMMKRAVTKKIGHPVWQKSFHDHVIRNEADYREIWRYIDGNPGKWEEDKLYML